MLFLFELLERVEIQSGFVISVYDYINCKRHDYFSVSSLPNTFHSLPVKYLYVENGVLHVELDGEDVLFVKD